MNATKGGAGPTHQSGTQKGRSRRRHGGRRASPSLECRTPRARHKSVLVLIAFECLNLVPQFGGLLVVLLLDSPFELLFHALQA